MPILPPVKELDLVTSVELTHTDTGSKRCYHMVYGSALYGTLFGVFGRFDTSAVGTTQKKVIGLHMRIVNYVGTLNIGFSTAAPTYYFDPVKKTRNVIFGVRGGSGNEEASLSFPTTASDQILVTQGTRELLIFNRIAFPISGFGVSSKPDQDEPEPSQTDQLFDSEFHYRSGVDHFHQYRRNGMSAKVDGPGPLDFKATGDMETLFPGLRCVQSNVNLLY